MWKADRVLLVDFGLQASVLCNQAALSDLQPSQFSLRRCGIQLHQCLAGLDNVSFPHGNLPDDASLKMLDRLVFTCRDEHA